MCVKSAVVACIVSSVRNVAAAAVSSEDLSSTSRCSRSCIRADLPEGSEPCRKKVSLARVAERYCFDPLEQPRADIDGDVLERWAASQCPVTNIKRCNAWKKWLPIDRGCLRGHPVNSRDADVSWAIARRNAKELAEDVGECDDLEWPVAYGTCPFLTPNLMIVLLTQT